MESSLFIIYIIIFIFICLFLFILHQQITNSQQSYDHDHDHHDQYTKNLHHTYFNSFKRFIKCIKLCNKLCSSIKTNHKHNFKVDNHSNINLNHQCDINPITVHISCSTIVDQNLPNNSLTYKTSKCIRNYEVLHYSMCQNDLNLNGKYSQSSMLMYNDPMHKT
uniref:Transmembrane protein n=1 Tax=Schistosoma rodhaini TaxID=6188 RepID=A0AA85FI88_9TREM